jgi:hypothetical protein
MQGQLTSEVEKSEFDIRFINDDNDEPFFRGLLKNAFMPALRQSCFVESWASALRAMTNSNYL